MSDAPTPSPETKPKRAHSANDQRIAAYITAAARFLKTATTDVEIQPVVTTHGFDAADLAHGAKLVKDAGDAWGVRTEGMGEEDEAVAESDVKLKAARKAYIQFRTIGRANFPDAAARTALGLSGDIAEGIDTFITQAKASYNAGQKAPYTAKLSLRSYTSEKLGTLLAGVENLTDAETDQTEAEGDAIGDTKARDAAYAALKTYMKELKGTLRGALSGQADLLAKLGM